MALVDGFRKLVKLKFLLAFSAVFSCYQTFVISYLQPSFTLLYFVFFSTLAAYNIRKFIFYPGLSQVAFKNKKQPSVKDVVFLGAVVLCFICWWQLSANLKITTAALASAALLYIMPFNRGAEKLKGIRNIFILKNIWLALSWASVTVALPLLAAGELICDQQNILIFLSRFLFVYSIALVFDIRDTHQDTQKNVITLPVNIGVKATKTVAIVCSFLFCMLIYWRATASKTFIDFSLPLYFSAVLLLLVILMAKPGQRFWFYEVVTDGLLLMQAVAVLWT